MTKDDDKQLSEHRHIQSYSILSVILVIVLFFSIMYGLNWLRKFYSTEKTSLACNDYSGSKVPPPIPAFTWQHTGLITLWFDDGWESQYSVAYPIMKEQGLVGAEAVVPNFVCQTQFLNWNNLHTMQDNGWEMTSHTVSHSCVLSYYNQVTTPYELANAKKIIQDHGLRADQFVMPCGYGKIEITDLFGVSAQTPPLLDVAEKYYQSYRTTSSTRENSIPVIDAYNLKAMQIGAYTKLDDVQLAIDQAKAQKNWLIFVFHQIDNSGREFSITESTFKKVLQMVKASGLPVVLPSQALSIMRTPNKTEPVLKLLPGTGTTANIENGG